MTQSAPTLKRLHFELGGKNPVVVFDDADLDRALDAVVFMIYSLNGERCTSSSRLLVQKSIEKEFTERLVARVRKHQSRSSARSGDRDRAADPSEARRESARLLRHRDARASCDSGRRQQRRRRRQLRSADGVRRRAQQHAHRSRGNLRSGADGHSRSPTRAKRSRSPTTCATAWPDTSGPTTSAAHTASRARSRPAWCGSTPKTIATCRHRSAA